MDRLKEAVFRQLRTDIDFETFLEIYKWATEKKHDFLCIDSRSVPVVFQ